MKFLIGACSDIGIKKETNQDGLSVKLFDTPSGQMVFAVLCDGMGGLAKGEVASSEVVCAFNKWFNKDLPGLIESGLDFNIVRSQWASVVNTQNDRIKNYGEELRINLGTTIVAMLFTENEYFAMNVGDSRAYEVSDNVSQITNDHSLIAHEIAQGNLTPEQAKKDSRRNVLLQCIGAGDGIDPEFYRGKIKNNSTYLVCSDGFVHEITNEEIQNAFSDSSISNRSELTETIQRMIDLNKSRNEKDNISVIAIKAN